MDKEVWKDIDGYPNYQVSNLGRVKNKQHILKQGISNRGYARVSLYNGIEVRHHSIHRLVALMYVLNPNKLPIVNHIDGTKLNNYASNLEWCTSKENVEHAFETGLRKDNNYVTIYDQQEDTITEFRSVHQAAKYLNISDEAVTVWKVRSEYTPIDGRYLIKDINVRRPKDSTPLYVYDHVADAYHTFINRMDFVLNTGLAPYTILERLKRYKQDAYYIAGYTTSLKELKDINKVATALEDRKKLFSKPPLKNTTAITAQFEDGTIKDYNTIATLIEERPDIEMRLVNAALYQGKVKNRTYMVRGVNLMYQDSTIPFTKYNKYAITNSKLGLSADMTVYKLAYQDTIMCINGNFKLAVVLGSKPTAVPQKYRLGRVVKTKDLTSKDVIVERVN